MKVAIIDVETTVKSKRGFAASPFSDNNYIVALGIHRFNLYQPYTEYTLPNVTYIKSKDMGSMQTILTAVKNAMTGVDMIVGHNLGFDLHHMRNYLTDDEWYTLTKDVMFWDTAISEFILSRQMHTFPTLENCLVKYKLGKKDSAIPEMWKNGVQTEDIDRDTLIAYLRGDVVGTYNLFIEHYKLLHQKNMMHHVIMEMEAFKATNEMEWNGICVDKFRLTSIQYELEKEAMACKSKLLSFIHDATLRDEYSPTKDNLNHVILFGGEFKYTDNEPIFDEDGEEKLFKSGPKKGQPRTRKITVTRKVNALEPINLPIAFLKTIPKLKNGKESLDRNSLLAIYNHVGATSGKAIFIDTLLQYRNIEKQLNTYIQNIKKHTWDEGRIHHSLNHTVAITGRLSCSNPNLQNQAN